MTLSKMYGLRLLAAPGVQRSVLVVLLGVVLAYRALQLVALSGEIQWGYDFSAYWLAAGHVLDRAPIYADFQLAGQYSPQQQYLYLYPPFLAVAMTPLAAIIPSDYRLANLVWAVLGAIVAAVVVAAVARRERIGAPRETVLLVGGAFAFPPLIGELVMGNVHLLLLGLLGGAWLALRDDRPSMLPIAGILVGVATLIKLFPGLVILWLVLRGRYRAALWSLAAIAVLAVATLPVTGIEAWLEYPRVLLNLGPPVDTRDTLAPIVWLSSFMPPVLARVVVVVAMVAAVVWAARRTSEPISFAVAVTASVLIAPALYQHYLAILVLPLLLALRWAPPWSWVAVAYLAMFGGEQSAFGESAWIINRLLPTLGALLLLVGLMIRGFAARPVLHGNRVSPARRRFTWAVVAAFGWAGLIWLAVQMFNATPRTAAFDLELLLQAGRDVAAGRSPYDPAMVAGGVPGRGRPLLLLPAAGRAGDQPVRGSAVGCDVRRASGSSPSPAWRAAAAIVSRSIDPGGRSPRRRSDAGHRAALPAVRDRPAVRQPRRAVSVRVRARARGGCRPVAAVERRRRRRASAWPRWRSSTRPASGRGSWAASCANAKGASGRALRVILAAVATVGAVLVLSLLAGGADLWRDYVPVAGAASNARLLDPRNAGPAAQLAMLLGGDEGARAGPPPAGRVRGLVASLWAGWAVKDRLSGIAVAAIASLVLLPVTWYHYPTALIPFAIAAVVRARGSAAAAADDGVDRRRGDRGDALDRVDPGACGWQSGWDWPASSRATPRATAGAVDPKWKAPVAEWPPALNSCPRSVRVRSNR